MALTRKMLTAMDIPAEKIDEIITAHSETVSAIKEERDGYKAKAEELATVKKDLDAANEKIADYESGDWENKYNTVKGEFDSYKTETENKAVKAAKETAYKQLLLDAGISDKRIASILKVSDVDGVELDKEGKIKDADKLTESVKTEWADFIAVKKEVGVNVAKPPENNGGETKKPSRAAQMVAQYRNEHYGNPKED